VENKPAATGASVELAASARNEQATSGRRRRNGDEGTVRYFLPKAGTSPTRPELGQEMASEGEALIEALKSGQIFFTLSAWKAVPEVHGKGSPVIVKQAVTRT
jgi:hypothetical protein